MRLIWSWKFRRRREKQKEKEKRWCFLFFSAHFFFPSALDLEKKKNSQVPRRVVRAQVGGRPRPVLRRPAQGRGQQLLEGGVDVRCVRGGERGGPGSGREAAVKNEEERRRSVFFLLFSFHLFSSPRSGFSIFVALAKKKNLL